MKNKLNISYYKKLTTLDWHLFVSRIQVEILKSFENILRESEGDTLHEKLKNFNIDENNRKKLYVILAWAEIKNEDKVRDVNNGLRLAKALDTYAESLEHKEKRRYYRMGPIIL